MIVKPVEGVAVVEVLAKGIFVDNAVVASVVEESRGDPRLTDRPKSIFIWRATVFLTYLEDKPTAKVHATDLLVAIGESWFKRVYCCKERGGQGERCQKERHGGREGKE